MIERIYWLGISDRAAVAWEEERDGDSVVVRGPVGLITWGQLSWQSLQDLGLSRLSSSRKGFPVWDQAEPPTKKEIEQAWKRGMKARGGARFGGSAQATLIKGSSASAPVPGVGPKLRLKDAGESAEDFYKRVAIHYKLAIESDGKPLQAIIESTGVTKSTAARWVREARARGFLPPTTRGRKMS